MQLHLERAELGLGQLRAERCLFQLTGLEALIIEKGVHANDDQGCDEDIDVKSETEVDPETGDQGGEQLAKASEHEPECR